MFVTNAVERREFALGNGGGAGEHGVDDFKVVAELADANDMIEDEALVGLRTLEGHGRIP
jgi:hypothetical protein